MKLLVDILAHMARGNDEASVTIHAELTTQQAADFLNVSRPYLIGLLEKRRLPYRKVGTHRRVLFKELLAYRERSDKERREILSQLTREAQDLGLY